MLAALAVTGLAMVGACGDDTSSDDGAPPSPSSANCEHAGIECAVLCSDTLGCVDCLADADCGAASPFCIQGECVECSGNEGCGDSRRCFPAAHECQDACATNDDCSEESPTCDMATGACVGCLDASDCDDALCHPMSRQCVECMSDLDCGTDRPVCDATGTCRECLVDASCPADAPLCMDHECLEPPEEGCESSSECDGDEPVCLPQSGECVGCVSNRDCGPSA
ncbi:MAG: hypothetical protein HOW73_48110, partial [Polyangiaceae bacterium]|nr:hypothetical protein [Polyangiaceae bacterium]